MSGISPDHSLSFTLAICTYNRAMLLARALESLSQCQRPIRPWQLIVIDNNSSDFTKEAVERFRAVLPVTYVFEPKQGLSHARNRALSLCESGVLLFTDDDLRFDEDWLIRYEVAFEKFSEAVWFGGRVRPWWEHGRPSWLKDEKLALIAGLLVHYDLGECDRIYDDGDPTPYGASFAIRRCVFESVGAFRVDLGVNGDVAARGEETEYFERVLTKGFKGCYVGSASAWHWQNPVRFSARYLYDYGVECGRAQRRIAGSSRAYTVGFLRQVKFAILALGQLVKGRGDRARQCLINIGIERGLRGLDTEV